MKELNILALDPGTEKTGVVYTKSGRVDTAEIYLNQKLIDAIRGGSFYPVNLLAIEQVRSYGMAIGASTLDTVEWSGRFIEAWENWSLTAACEIHPVLRLPRIQIKTHLCHSARAKDANIRQALIDRLGEPGTKRNPGPTYGIKSHLWAALAVAVVAWDMMEKGKLNEAAGPN